MSTARHSFKSRLFSRYLVSAGNLGFDLSLLKDEDARDAVAQFLAMNLALDDMADQDVVALADAAYDGIQAGKSWREFLKVSPAEWRDPLQVIENASYDIAQDRERGFLKKLPESKWAAELGHVDLQDSPREEGYDHILKNRAAGKLAPAIEVEGVLADGWHRCLLQYGLGEKVPVVNLTFKR